MGTSVWLRLPRQELGHGAEGRPPLVPLGNALEDGTGEGKGARVGVLLEVLGNKVREDGKIARSLRAGVAEHWIAGLKNRVHATTGTSHGSAEGGALRR